jgi:hypothetical protein
MDADLLKAGYQFIAVVGGVSVGWWLNARSQARARLLEARANWVAAAEDLLGAIEGTPMNVGVLRDDPGFSQIVADFQGRHRRLEEMRSTFRAASARITMLDRPSIDKIREIEGSGVTLSVNVTREATATSARAHVEALRAQIREVADRWRALPRDELLRKIFRHHDPRPAVLVPTEQPHPPGMTSPRR